MRARPPEDTAGRLLAGPSQSNKDQPVDVSEDALKGAAIVAVSSCLSLSRVLEADSPPAPGSNDITLYLWRVQKLKGIH